MHRLQSRTFTWHFDSPPEAVQPALADTARANEAAGLPKHVIHEALQPDGSVRLLAEARKGPVRLEWEEVPVEWVHGQWFRHERAFTRGPLASLIATLRLEPQAGGAVGRYTIEAAPRTLLGRLLLATGFFASAGRTFTHLANLARDWAAHRRETAFESAGVRVAGGRRDRLEAAIDRIEASGNGHGLAERLTRYLTSAQEMDLVRLRPYPLAAHWHHHPREVVELCLQAVVDGVLELRWDLLCPRCRGAKMSVLSLDRLPTRAHCASCNIGYDRDFERNVEVSFRPAEWLRPIPDGEYCLLGPMTTPHIRAQLTVGPGETREVPADLPPGDYRLRTFESGGESDITWDGGAFPELVMDGGTVRPGAPAPPGRIRLVNRGDRRRTAVIEDRTWLRDALTADRVTTLQTFRDLFPDAGLRAGEEAPISQAVLMFTDLKDSTALYERIGDAAAYGLVRQHFRFLTSHVRAHDGGVVKTIGDAVMAVFSEPAKAVAAGVAIQRAVAAFNATSGGEPLAIKLGLHQGPCVAVTLNDRLDYFGSAVNMAARLQSRSAGGDIVLSNEMMADAQVAELVRGLAVHHESCALKGLTGIVSFHRISAEALAAG